jgi:hypothetical protein
MTLDGEMTIAKVVDLDTTLLLTTFSFEIIYPRKIMFECITFEIQNFQATLDGGTTKTKFVLLCNVFSSDLF